MPESSLTRKLVEVMAAVKHIPKHGRNDFHKYDYATEADIVAAIRGELASRHVLLIPAITGEQRHSVGDKGSWLTVLEMEMEFRDAETGESITKPWRGYGTDKEDKGGYKAMTGGEKYFLLKTFLIPTGDDPEDEPKPARRAEAPRRVDAPRLPPPVPPAGARASAPPEAPKPDPNVRYISEPQRKRLHTIATNAGWQTEEVKKLLATRYHIDSSSLIPIGKYDEVCKLLEAGTVTA